MNRYSEEDLKKLKKIEIEILEEIIRICSKYDIKYFSICGTTLGAVRHNGFIPWDDDIDIGMLREDYEKFLTISKTELNEKFMLGHLSLNKHCPFVFAKIYRKGTIFLEKCNKRKRIYHCVYVDIMPFDYLPDETDSREKVLKRQTFWNKLFALKCYICTYRHNRILNFIVSIFRLLLFILILPFNKKKIFTKLEKVLSNNGVKTNYVATRGYKETVASLEDIFPLKEHVFENININIPNNYDAILTNLYGKNYMKIPDEKDRIQHCPIKLFLDV